MRVVRQEDTGDRLSWQDVVDALAAGHRLPVPSLDDVLLAHGTGQLLSRAAAVPGLGSCVKSVTVLADNAARGVPTVQGGVLVFAEDDGRPEALLDGRLVTWWKTAADSALLARHLARPDSRVLLVVGAGTVAASVVPAHRAVLPAIEEVLVWSRTDASADALAVRLADEGHPATAVRDLPAATARADVVATATTSPSPVLHGAWVRPGTHVDLIGAYTPTMREADDELVANSRLFVDARETTIEHIGELMIPLAAGVITRDDVLGDLRDLEAGAPGRRTSDEVTVAKNGGGAHLDLFTCRAILSALEPE